MQGCGNTDPMNYGTFWPGLFSSLLSCAHVLAYCSVSIYQTFTRFIREYPVYMAGCTFPQLGLHVHVYVCIIILHVK